MYYWILRSRLGLTNLIIVFLAAILTLAIFYLGPIFPVGDPGWWSTLGRRLWWTGGVWGVALFLMIFFWILRRRRDRKLTEDIVEADEPDPSDVALQAELRELKDKLKTAMKTLRKSKMGRRSLYNLPWYIMIGPSGAGKTTAIVNSGLDFPLAETLGKEAIGGVGGTRNCDWWFTNDAVLIDTAGRYTLQDSDAEADQGAWSGFLEMLKKHRKRQPINGAMIAISLSDLSMQDELTQKAHARAIRKRLHELRQRLGVRFPVYVLFTKADLIAGFQEFFETLGKEDREQVWGFTFELDKSKGDKSPVAEFNVEFDNLLMSLHDRKLELMQHEIDHARRALISGFPNQVASLRGVAHDFLGEIFQDNRFEDRHMLRGVYFTSGTQDGTPIDRLMMGMARTFGIGRQAIGTGQGSGRSFFLRRLIEGVIFREAGLVSADDKVERRYRWIVRGSVAAGIVLAGLFGALWTGSFIGNRQLILNAETQIEAYQDAVSRIPGSPINDTNLASVVEPLDILRKMPGNPAIDYEPPLELTYGLYQGDTVGTQAFQTYRSALNQVLLPRLLLQLENLMKANINNDDVLYETLKIYLMLGLAAPYVDEEEVTTFFQANLLLAYPGANNQDLRDTLNAHIATLVSQPMIQIDLNGQLVDQVQGILTETPLSKRIYDSIVASPGAQALPEWRLTDAGGPQVARVLALSSGDALNEGIEGVYTYDGFHNYFLRQVLSVPQRIQRESWVLGPRGEAEVTPAVLANLTRDVLNLYYTDYIARYDKMLGDIDIKPMESLSDATEVMNILSGPTSPIASILEDVAYQTRLAEVQTVDAAAAQAASGAEQLLIEDFQSAFDARSQALLGVLGGAAGTALQGGQEEDETPGQFVQDRFSWLHDLVEGQEGLPSGLSTIMQTLTEVYNELNRMNLSRDGSYSAFDDDTALQRLEQEATRYQGPLQRWAQQISEGATGIRTEGTRADLNAAWQADVLPTCQRVVNERYPFSRRSQSDVPLADFARLFSVDGLIDQFMSDYLDQYIDKSTTPWRWRRAGDSDLGISDQVLRMFEYAEDIQNAFFLQAGTSQISFDVTPFALDPTATQMILEIDGTSIEYAHGPLQTTPVIWPGNGRTRLTLAPPISSGESNIATDGPWAWFRLLDRAQLRGTSDASKLRALFVVGGRNATVEIRAGTAVNPFSLEALSGFRCPTTL